MWSSRETTIYHDKLNRNLHNNEPRMDLVMFRCNKFPSDLSCVYPLINSFVSLSKDKRIIYYALTNHAIKVNIERVTTFDSQPWTCNSTSSPKVDICMSNYFDIHKLKHQQMQVSECILVKVMTLMTRNYIQNHCVNDLLQTVSLTGTSIRASISILLLFVFYFHMMLKFA